MSPTKSSSSLAITDHKLIPTSRGISLVYKGYVFARTCSMVNKKSLWRCTFNYDKCPAKLYTIEDDKVICAIVGEHSAHKVVPNVDKVLEYKQYLREKATTTQDEPQAIIDLANAQFDIGSKACTKQTKHSIINNARVRAGVFVPDEISDNIKFDFLDQHSNRSHNMSHTKSSLAITDHKLIRTLRGISLVYEGHVFTRSEIRNNKTHWRCIYFHKHYFPYTKCPARLHTIDSEGRVICAIVGEHSAHSVDPNKPKVLEYKQYLMDKATTTQDEPQAIIDLANAQFDIGSTACTEKTKHNIINNARMRVNHSKRNVLKPETSRIAYSTSRSKTKHARPNMLNKKKRVLLRSRRMRQQSTSVPIGPPSSPTREISDNITFDFLDQHSNRSHNMSPTKSSSPSSLAITDHKLIPTLRAISLVYKGHVFSRISDTVNNRKTFWRCIFFNTEKCPAKLHTIEQGKVICAIIGQHSHSVDPIKPKVLEYKQYLMEQATTTKDKPKKIIDLANAKFTFSVGSAAGTISGKRSMIRIARKHVRVGSSKYPKNVLRLQKSRITASSSRSVAKAKRTRSNMLNKKKRALLRNRRTRHQASSSSSVQIESRQPTNEIPDNNIQSIIQTELSKCILENQKLVRICRLWSSLIGTQKTARVKYVKLNINESGSPLEWKPVPSIRAMQFESVWDEPTDLQPDQKGSYTIAGVYLNNQQRAKTFGYLFPNVKTLVIYFDLPDTETHIQNLIDLLSKCIKLDSLSLIMSSEISSETTLPRICHTINTDVKTLKRLDLFVSDYESDMHDKFGRHSSVDLFESIPLVTHLALSCSPRNLLTLLIEAGSVNNNLREYLETHSLQSLSLQCRLSDLNMDKLFTANSEIFLVKRLQLTCVFNFDFVQNYLKLFTNVENLQLYACQPSALTLKSELIEHLRQLPKLSELTLVDFGMVMDLPNVQAYQLPTVKKFTIAAHDLFTRYRRVTGDNQYFRFIDTIVHLFPTLEELVLLAGEIGPPFRWKWISSELPKLFMYKCPTLQRVTINLKHPNLVNVAMRKRLHV